MLTDGQLGLIVVAISLGLLGACVWHNFARGQQRTVAGWTMFALTVCFGYFSFVGAYMRQMKSIVESYHRAMDLSLPEYQQELRMEYDHLRPWGRYVPDWILVGIPEHLE